MNSINYLKNSKSNSKESSHSNIGSSYLDPIEIARKENILDTFVFVNGRRYVADDSVNTYHPNDETEMKRACDQFYLYNHIWGGSFNAPVREALMLGRARVLDVGCGSGIWIMDQAIEAPISSFIGVDCAPVFPEEKTRPKNIGFIQYNLIEGIPFPDSVFDYVHQRLLLCEINEKKWTDNVLKEMVRVTKPGGWIEIEERAFPIQNIGPIGKEINYIVEKFCKDRGINEQLRFSIPKLFEEVGLTKVQLEDKIMLIGSWGGRIGSLLLEDLLKHIDAVKCAIPGMTQMSEDQLKEFSNESNEYSVHFIVYRAWAQKPDDNNENILES
ncbi:hypothetical protein G9A89_010415 [Geosiphon pyriformis]|nr:hypothetical protein G9A89_010415 [Geosiphon pyriformis]